jgi:hypothetical protein
MKGLPYYKRLEVLTAVSPRRVLGLLEPEGEGTVNRRNVDDYLSVDTA